MRLMPVCALAQRTLDWRLSLGGVTPANLPMAEHIGRGRSLFDRRAGSDPTSRMRDAALKAGITESRRSKGGLVWNLRCQAWNRPTV
jgi:hypothetical protein